MNGRRGAARETSSVSSQIPPDNHAGSRYAKHCITQITAVDDANYWRLWQSIQTNHVTCFISLSRRDLLLRFFWSIKAPNNDWFASQIRTIRRLSLSSTSLLTEFTHHMFIQNNAENKWNRIAIKKKQKKKQIAIAYKSKQATNKERKPSDTIMMIQTSVTYSPTDLRTAGTQ